MRTCFTRAFLFIVLCNCRAWPDEAAKAPGVPNFHQVNEHLYRGAQPTAEGFKSLAKLGIKMVIDLRRGNEHERSEEKLAKAAGIRYVSVPLHGLAAPTDEQIQQLFTLLDDSSHWPVFIHCKRGADRTGTVVACYRIAHDRWANQKALEEARLLGMSWMERAMQQYILYFSAKGKPPLTTSPAKPPLAIPQPK